MQSSLPEKHQEVPPVPIKTYQWEDVKRARLQGGYPWTHLDKPPLEGEDITAELILRNSAPLRRSMSREPSRDRSGGRSPTPSGDGGAQKILMLDASPGSSRKLGEGEDDAIVHVPNFSKEISLDSEEDILEKENVNKNESLPGPANVDNLKIVNEPKITVSPKGILKRKHPDRTQVATNNDESPRNSKCCHPFVEKIKHIADKTIHKTEKQKKTTLPKRKPPIDEPQEIIPLECSPGLERREKHKHSEEFQKDKDNIDDVKISLVMQTGSENIGKEPAVSTNKNNVFSIPSEFLGEPSPPTRKRKEHIYEDIEKEDDVFITASPTEDDQSLSKVLDEPENNETKIDVDQKSGDSKDPSLLIDEPMEDEESTSESISKLKTMYDVAMTPDKIENHENEAVITESDETESSTLQANRQQENSTPNITITEIEDYVEDENMADPVVSDNTRSIDKDDPENMGTLDKRVHFQVSESLSDPEPIEENSTPADENENFWSKMNDHEYEPIGKPAAEVAVADEQVYIEDDASSTTSQEREVLRLPLDQATGDNEAYSGTDDRDTASSAIAMQKQIEDRYFVNTPTTTESRTDCEISTSQVDSSALEDLPLKRENRKRASVEASKLQQRIKNQTGKLRNQAGKLKTKIKGMKKPQFSMPERPKFERPKFTMPERPKINFPDRPKISLPDRPKFKLPERPKINLPDRPKINFPDRPKFNFPDRPKFSLPDRSKFKFPDRPKINFSTFTRNKENNRRTEEEHDQSTESTSGSRKNKINFDFRTYPRFFNRNKKEKGDAMSSNRPGTPPPTFATVPRIKKERLLVGGVWDESSARSTEDQPRQYGGDKGYNYKNDKDFESKLAQVDKDYRQMQAEYEQENLEIQKSVKAKLENAELWNAMERNNAAKIDHRVSLPYILPSEEARDPAFEPGHEDDESSAASAGNHQRGVLEEIDNDEFFLRQKGISQDNIEVGKYLTDEIRDAFRSPVNALSQMDPGERYQERNVPEDTNFNYPQQDDRYYQFNKDDSVEQDEPMEYHQNENGFMAENDDGYYTFPPVRPSRARKIKTNKPTEDSSKYIEDIELEPEIRVQVHNMAIESIPAPDMFSEPISQSYSEEESIDKMRMNSFGYKDPDILENLNEYENEIEQTREIPAIPKRRKKNIKESSSYMEDEPFLDEPLESEKWDEPIDNEDKSMNDEIVVHRVEYVMEKFASPDVNEAPVLPRRTRSRSRGSRATSVGDDDRTSRGAESIVLDSHTQLPTADLDFLDDLDDGPGYAIVDKLMPQRKIEPASQPSAPFRRHRSAKSLSSDRDYFTVPRALKEASPPKRPLRNYSTLGPSRPPRKKFSTTSLTNLEDLVANEPGSETTQYVEIDNEDQELHKDLKSGEIISKMKDRPLPPPPRPPRGPKKKKELSDRKDYMDDPEIDPGVFEFNESFQLELDNKKIMEELKHQENVEENAKESERCLEEEHNDLDPYYQDDVIEIEVSTQTDPLPDDFDYELGMEGIEFNDNLECISSTAEALPETLKDDTEENSIDVEILSRGLQKFRESSRPSSRSGRPKTPSERQKTPTERPKTPLGRMSPTAILVERRVSSPTRINERDEIVTEASLTVMPIDEPLTFSSESKSFSSQNQPCPELPSFPTQAQMWQNRDLFPKDDEFQPECRVETKPPQPVCLDLEDECASPVELPRNIIPNTINSSVEADVVRTQRLQVSDLEVDRLSVTELQAQKILVSEIEGLSLQVSDMNSKSGHIYVRGIDLAPGIVEEILQKFSQLSSQSSSSEQKPRSDTTQETQTENESFSPSNLPPDVEMIEPTPVTIENLQAPPTVPPPPVESTPVINNDPPERPPLPTIPPSLYPMAYYPEYSLPPGSFYRLRSPNERNPADYSEDLPAAPSRRRKHKREPVSSSDEEYRPSARRQHMPRQNEPSVSELSVQLFRACQTSVTRTIQHIISYITSHFGTGEDKKDVQMALVIILVMIAGLIMLGVGDGRTVHHHHWDFFNPPTNEK